MNEISDLANELCATPLIEIVRTMGQNLYTQEVFIEYDMSDSERPDNKSYYGNVTPWMYEIIEMYEGEASRSILIRSPNIIPKINEIDFDKSRIFMLRTDISKIREVLALISQYCTSITTRKIVDNDDELIVTGNLDYRRLTMTRRAYIKDNEYKLSIHDYDDYIPNGFGVDSGRSILTTSKILNPFTIFKEVTYKAILNKILTLDGIEQVYCIGSRNLTELTAIPYDIKMIAYDKMSTSDERLANVNIEVIEEWWDFMEMNLVNNTVYLFLYVIPNNQNGLYRSESQQIEIIKNMCEKVSSGENIHVFVNFYSDNYNDVASRVKNVPNFEFSDGKFLVYGYVAETVRYSELIAQLGEYNNMIEEERLTTEEIYDMMLDQGITCSQDYILLRGYMQEWYTLLHISKP